VNELNVRKQQRQQSLGPFVGVAFAQRVILQRNVPIGLLFQTVAVEEQVGAGFEFINVLENRVRRGDVAVSEVLADRQAVKAATGAGMHQQSL
jgi:hypothetical protein